MQKSIFAHTGKNKGLNDLISTKLRKNPAKTHVWTGNKEKRDIRAFTRSNR
jgi:hypothetical protein